MEKHVAFRSLHGVQWCSKIWLLSGRLYLVGDTVEIRCEQNLGPVINWYLPHSQGQFNLHLCFVVVVALLPFGSINPLPSLGAPFYWSYAALNQGWWIWIRYQIWAPGIGRGRKRQMRKLSVRGVTKWANEISRIGRDYFLSLWIRCFPIAMFACLT